MTRMPDIFAEVEHDLGHPPAIHQEERPMSSVLAPLRGITDALAANPLALRLLETGIGQHLSDADVETVIRTAVAIEAARKEVPHGFRPERPADIARDLAHDVLSPDVAERILT